MMGSWPFGLAADAADHRRRSIAQRLAAQAALEITVLRRNSLTPDRRVRRDDAIHTRQFDRAQHVFHFAFGQIRRDLDQHGHARILRRAALRIEVRTVIAHQRHFLQQPFDELARLQLPQIQRVRAADVDRHVVGVTIHLLEQFHVIFGGLLDGRVFALADVDAHLRGARAESSARRRRCSESPCC